MGKTEKKIQRIAKFLTKAYSAKIGERVFVSKRLSFYRQSVNSYEIAFFGIKIRKIAELAIAFEIPMEIEFKDFDLSKLVRDIWTEITNYQAFINIPDTYCLRGADFNICRNAIQLCKTMYPAWADDEDVKKLESALENVYSNKLSDNHNESKNTSESVQSAR